MLLVVLFATKTFSSASESKEATKTETETTGFDALPCRRLAV